MRQERLPVILLLIFCGLSRSQTRAVAGMPYAIRHDTMPPYSSPFSQTPENDKPVSLCWSAVSVVTGALVGTLLGGTVGALLPHRWSHDVGHNGFRGAVTGLCLGPFFMYELTAGRGDQAHRQRRWGFHVGGNLTDVNYDYHEKQNGLVAGVSRSYRLYRHLNLDAIMQYSAKQFSLYDRPVAYATPATSEIHRYNILFDVGYLDIHISPKVNLFKNGVRVGIGAGPVVSVQVAARTKFQVLERKKTDLQHAEFEFIYETDEPGGTSPYPGYGINIEVEAKKIMAQFSYKSAFGPTHQIYRFTDATRLRTVQFTLAAWID